MYTSHIYQQNRKIRTIYSHMHDWQAHQAAVLHAMQALRQANLANGTVYTPDDYQIVTITYTHHYRSLMEFFAHTMDDRSKINDEQYRAVLALYHAWPEAFWGLADAVRAQFFRAII